MISKKIMLVAQIVALMLLGFASAAPEAVEQGLTTQDNVDLAEPVEHRGLRRRHRRRRGGKRDKCRHFYCPSDWTPINDYWRKCRGKCDKYECCYKEKKKTCKDDYYCPAGYSNVGNKECRGDCDEHECCEKKDEKCSDFYCPKGWDYLYGDIKCHGKCDKYDCCEKKRGHRGRGGDYYY